MATKREKELIEKIKSLSKKLQNEKLLRKKKVKQDNIDSIVVVSNRLPIVLKKNANTGKWTTTKASGGLVSAMTSLNLKIKWIGWVGLSVEDLNDQNEIKKILEEINCIPVFLPKGIGNKYYNGFSNDVLWPILHYVQLPIKTLRMEREYWMAYEETNLRFSSVVLENSKEDEMIWVHDYHLMLLPKFIRKERTNAKIGWFLHTPFPNCDIFRTLSFRNELLKGLLCADLVGFHIYNYVKNFKAACVEILGCDANKDSIDINGKLTMIDAFPIGIDVKKFEKIKNSPSFEETLQNLRKKHGDVKIIIGVDRLDYIKGIMHKMAALELFFDKNKDLIDKVTYVQIAVPTRPNVPEYQKLAEQVHEFVGRVNGKFSNLTHVPIHYLDQSLDLETLVALYSIADVCLVSSLRDGMNLVSYEFVASQKEDIGVLILSEFTGAAQSLGAGSVRINPWNLPEVAESIRMALNMNHKERLKLHEYNKRYLSEHSSQTWAEEFIISLKDSWNIKNFVYERPTIPKEVNMQIMKQKFDKSDRRIIFSGVIGTLTNIISCGLEFQDYLNNIKLSESIIHNLSLLSNNKDTDVVILSSRKRNFLDKVFENIPVIICAENGYYLKDNSVNSEWIKTADSPNLSWMDATEKVMSYFVERTPSSFIDRLETSIYWHYCNCNDNFSENQSRDLIANLQTGPLMNMPTEVIHNKQDNYIMVRLIHFNKLYGILRALDYLKMKEDNMKLKDFRDSNFKRRQSDSGLKNEISPKEQIEGEKSENSKGVKSGEKMTRLVSELHYEFALCIGSYFESDQDAFLNLNECTAKNGDLIGCDNLLSVGSRNLYESMQSVKNVFTVSVGKRKSLAKEYLKNSKDVEKMIRYLAN